MLYSPEDPRYPHLEFVREIPTADRRKSRGGRPNPPPDRGSRTDYGTRLQEATEHIIAEQEQKRPPPAGIRPHLVFRVPLAEKARIDTVTELLEQHGLTIVSVETDGAVIAFRDDTDLHAFQEAIRKYQAGPQWNQRTGRQAATSRFDVLAYLEASKMTLWSRTDRVGSRLAQKIRSDGSAIEFDTIYTVDVELWHPGTKDGVQRQFDELSLLVNDQALPEKQVLDTYRGTYLLLAKVRVYGQKLDRLLDLDGIAEVDLPPIASFDPRNAKQITAREIPVPPRPSEDGPRVCIIDSGIVSNHPLLGSNVGHEEAIFTRDTSPADTHGHGTMVGGLAVFGDIRSCYESRTFTSPVVLFSARVLNDQNGFDDETLIINQVRRAIEIFVSAPHNCRIFNISIGSSFAGIGTQTRRQNQYAEALDILAREFDVLLVVAAGNHQEAIADTQEEAEQTLRNYPQIFSHPQARLSDFATAAIPLTVGAIASSEEIAKPRSLLANDIVRPLTRAGEPAPMTRVGPGIMGAIKPDVVHYGGSYIFDRSAARRIRLDEGLAVMSFSHQPTETLFAYDCGTSFAAPQVARIAALLEHRLSQDLGTRPHPNLVRAVLATATTPTLPLEDDRRFDEHMCIKACGYGLPDEDMTLSSTNRRITIYAQDQIPLDQFHIYRIPVPDEFLHADGMRSIRVALAFDPPVRGRRIDYLGVEMNMTLIRGKTLDEVTRKYSKLSPGDSPDDVFKSKFQAKLIPSSSSRHGGYSRKKSTLQVGTFTIKRGSPEKYGNEYWLVLIAERKWAPPEIEYQNYAVAVTLEANTPELYARVQQRIRSRVRARARV